MTDPYHHPPPNRAILLKNLTCVYCGETFGKTLPPTKEHVIGRRFVPKGTLDQSWNLIVQACKPCNNRKSQLEDDISAITLFHGLKSGNSLDAEHHQDAIRKATNAISRKTGMPVAHSGERLTMSALLGGTAKLDFAFNAPPQMDRDRLFDLAKMQLMAFFYWISYNPTTKTGGFWKGTFFQGAAALRTDWGNPVHRAFMKQVAGWDTRLHAIAANEYFKLTVRRHPSEYLYAWALEWNAQLRLFGCFGDPAVAQEIERALPPLEMVKIAESETRWVQYRIEQALPEEEDIMFDPPPDAPL